MSKSEEILCKEI